MSFGRLFHMRGLAIFGMVMGCDLGLSPCFHHIQRTCYDAGEPSGRHCGEDLQAEANIITSFPALCKSPLLLVKGKLQGRERQVSDNRCLVPRIECCDTLDSSYCPCRIPRGLVVVTRVKEGVVVSTLQLQPCFQNFRWYVYNRSRKIGEKTWMAWSI